jgi:hypothetical protein
VFELMQPFYLLASQGGSRLARSRQFEEDGAGMPPCKEIVP